MNMRKTIDHFVAEEVDQRATDDLGIIARQVSHREGGLSTRLARLPLDPQAPAQAPHLAPLLLSSRASRKITVITSMRLKKRI